MILLDINTKLILYNLKNYMFEVKKKTFQRILEINIPVMVFWENKNKFIRNSKTFLNITVNSIYLFVS